MPTVKTQTFHQGGHHATCVARRRYLEEDERHLDCICQNIANPERWAKEMDKTREVYRLRGNVTYREFILSPDVADNASADTVRAMAIEWCQTNFPDAEVAIILHDDNKERISKGQPGIVHAHCVVNTVDLGTGRKVVLPNDKVRELHNSLQRIGEKLRLSVQPDYKKGERLQSKQTRKRTLSERQIELRDMQSWKTAVRDMAIQALSISATPIEFTQCLDKADVDMIVDRGRIYLVDRDNPTRACRADKLDESLSAKSLAELFGKGRDQVESNVSHLEKVIKLELAQGEQMRKEMQKYDLKCRKALDNYKTIAKNKKNVAYDKFPKFAMPKPSTTAEKARHKQVWLHFITAADRIRQQFAEPLPQKKQIKHSQETNPRSTHSTSQPQRTINRGR